MFKGLITIRVLSLHFASVSHLERCCINAIILTFVVVGIPVLVGKGLYPFEANAI